MVWSTTKQNGIKFMKANGSMYMYKNELNLKSFLFQ